MKYQLNPPRPHFCKAAGDFGDGNKMAATPAGWRQSGRALPGDVSTGTPAGVPSSTSPRSRTHHAHLRSDKAIQKQSYSIESKAKYVSDIVSDTGRDQQG